MIAARCSAPCVLQRGTESGLQARPLFFRERIVVQAVKAEARHACGTLALFTLAASVVLQATVEAALVFSPTR
jgi:hypothetical protein